MNILQKEIQERSQAISTMGNLMASGVVDITPETESIFQTGLAAMITANEQDKAVQDRVLKKSMTGADTAKRSASLQLIY